MGTQDKEYTLEVVVHDNDAACGPIFEAPVKISPELRKQRGQTSQAATPQVVGETDRHGHFRTQLPRGTYLVEAMAFGIATEPQKVEIPKDCKVTLRLPLGFSLDLKPALGTGDWQRFVEVGEGSALLVKLSWHSELPNSALLRTNLTSTLGTVVEAAQARPDQGTTDQANERYYYVDFRAARGIAELEATLEGGSGVRASARAGVAPVAASITGDVNATLQRTGTQLTDDVGLWLAIRNGTDALSFNNYLAFMNELFCGEPASDLLPFEKQRFIEKKQRSDDLLKRRFLPFTDTDAYRVLKAATEAFVMVNCGIVPTPPFDRTSDLDYLRRRDLPLPTTNIFNDYLKEFGDGSSKTLPYLAVIRKKLPDIAIKLTPFDIATENEQVSQCFGILQEKLTNPCLLELIWSYWHEEGMLAQTINAITRRFQNIRGPALSDALANLEIDPLRPLNNLLWGYLQDEQHRLSVVRRNYEYDHHYGLRLEGRAVDNPRTADTRSKFLEAFNHLLRLCTAFFRQDDDTTVKADAFPVLHALKELHLILSEGAHGQFGDLPSTARIEMLMQQWLLARPEFREFLPTRIMVAYPEPWMDRVDAMKKLQGWTDTSVLDFRNLAMFGEQILLSIRYGHWSDVQDPVQALNWARFWRPQVQGYIHAYRATTGVDLTAERVTSEMDATPPSILLKRRLAAQQRTA